MRADVIELLERPTLTLTDAAKTLGVSRTAMAAAADAGRVPTIDFDRMRRVPTVWIKRKLMIDDDA